MVDLPGIGGTTEPADPQAADTLREAIREVEGRLRFVIDFGEDDLGEHWYLAVSKDAKGRDGLVLLPNPFAQAAQWKVFGYLDNPGSRRLFSLSAGKTLKVDQKKPGAEPGQGQAPIHPHRIGRERSGAAAPGSGPRRSTPDRGYDHD
ncbi:hypothetical protein ABZ752_13845 [Streptomyces roseifaciens]